jgi:hypothetical protein
MKSMKATRWTREAILSAGNVFAFEDDPDPADASGAGGANTDPADSDDGAGSDDDKDDVDPKILKQRLQNKREEQERDFKKRKEAEKRADELQKIVDEQERKGKSELENAKTDLAAKDKVIAAKDDTIRRLTIENAFMTLKEIEWNNPATALKLVDLSDVEFDEETGKVKDSKQLLKAAKELAVSDPYLVKSKTDVSNETPSGKPSGKPPVGGKPKEVTNDAIKTKYNIIR